MSVCRLKLASMAKAEEALKAPPGPPAPGAARYPKTPQRPARLPRAAGRHFVRSGGSGLPAPLDGGRALRPPAALWRRGGAGRGGPRGRGEGFEAAPREQGLPARLALIPTRVCRGSSSGRFPRSALAVNFSWRCVGLKAKPRKSMSSTEFPVRAWKSGTLLVLFILK